MNRSLADLIDSISITHKFNNSELIFLNTSDILEGKILNNNYLKIEKLKGQAKKTIKFDDILFSEIRPKNKRFAYVNLVETEDYVVSTKLMVLRNKTKDVLTKYIYYFLTYEGTLDYLQMRAENRIGSFPQITFDILRPITLEIPSLADQEQIVSVISNIDNKLELNNQLNDNLECLAKTLYDYWFVQFDFPDENGKPYKSSGGKMIWNEVLKRETPQGWENKKIDDLFTISNETINPLNFPKKLFKHYSIPKWDSSKTYGNELGNTINSNKFIVKNGDVLISKLNPWFNRVVYNTDKEDIICSTEFVILKTSSNEQKAFLFQLAKSDKFKSYCILNAVGTSNSHKRINPQTLTQYTFPFHKNTMISFGNKVFSFLEKIKCNHTQNQKLISLRDWLLPMLMNGQVKVE